MEACAAHRRAVADVMQPSRVDDRATPTIVEKFDDHARLLGHRSRVWEARSHVAQKLCG